MSIDAASPAVPLPARTRAALMATFFASGAAALLYQVAWQRALSTIYGTNVEAVTVIVSAFMLGLGVGSLGGGHLSERSRLSPLRWFALAELSIGAFGIVSLRLFDAVAALTGPLSTGATAAIAFVLVAIPTGLMGMTLPLLVAYTVRARGSVGKSVSALYFVNTLGSAIAALCAGKVLLGALGLGGTVHLAAAINLFVGAGAMLLSFGGRR